MQHQFHLVNHFESIVYTSEVMYHLIDENNFNKFIYYLFIYFIQSKPEFVSICAP